MKYRIGIKTLLSFTAFIIIFFALHGGAFASDYQYKILDPKYNPSAENLVDGTIPPVQVIEPIQTKKGFDFGTFFAILAVVAFPMFIISLAVKTFKEVTEDVPGRERQTLGNVKIEKNDKIKNKTVSRVPLNNKTAAEISSNPSVKKVKSVKMSQKTKQMINLPPQTSRYATSPVDKKNPLLLNTSVLTSNKGLCLVEYNQKYSLIGYINDDIFLLNQFDNVNSREIRSRLSETLEDKDRYIVRLGNYKAIVEVTDSNMDLLLEL